MKKLYSIFVFLLFVGVVFTHTACSQGEDTPYNLLPATGDEEAAPTADEDCADNEFVTADCVEFEEDQAADTAQ